MVNIAVCDDDGPFRQSLIDMLRKRLQVPVIISQFGDGVELLRVLEQGRCLIDLVLLDIRMPKLDGIETARRIRQLDAGAVVILITEFGEYVFQGYDVRAFHFLTKPLDEARLLPVLVSAISEVEQNRAEFLTVNSQNQCRNIPLKDVLYIESSGRKKLIHTGSEVLELYENMATMSCRLEQKGFCRIHRGLLVNLDAVRRVDKAGLWVHLRDGRKLEISRRRLGGLLLALLGEP